jgi:hypothetical protein
MTTLRAAARHLGLGKATLRLYHRPIGLVRQSIAEGGPFEQRRTAAGHAAMIAAADELPTLVERPTGPKAEVAFVSGPRFWHQTAFCFVSLQLVSPFKIVPVVFDDGDLTGEICVRLRRVIPWVRFVAANETEARLDRHLPERAFPALRARRRVYPHLRKLMDIHLAADGFTLVLDSDMLFFRKAVALLEWFAAPHALYMQDVSAAYGYPRAFLADLVGAPIPELVNVGMYALDSRRLDWDRIEYWCRRQIEVHGPHYLQEQALTAMVLAGADAIALPRRDYAVMPDLAEGRNPTAVLHHYVAHSKRSYFQHCWQRILEAARITSDRDELAIAST